MELLGGSWILRVHIHHEVGVGGKERHLAFRIATIGAVCVGLDELPDSEAVRGFVGGYGNVFAHELVSFSICSGNDKERSLEDGPRFEKRLDPERTEFAAYA